VSPAADFHTVQRAQLCNFPAETPEPLFQLTVPVEDGPVMLAARPEALTIRPVDRPDAATVHRAVDFGTHKMVDVDLADGSRSVARSHDQELMASALIEDLVGAEVILRDGIFTAAAQA
jgi:putative spermidine/putrescine transport system ATP-binding protein